MLLFKINSSLNFVLKISNLPNDFELASSKIGQNNLSRWPRICFLVIQGSHCHGQRKFFIHLILFWLPSRTLEFLSEQKTRLPGVNFKRILKIQKTTQNVFSFKKSLRLFMLTRIKKIGKNHTVYPPICHILIVQKRC